MTRIYSVADQLPPETPLIRQRLFRSPHHTISHAGLVGGGNWPHPGEISLAHRAIGSGSGLLQGLSTLLRTDQLQRRHAAGGGAYVLCSG